MNKSLRFFLAIILFSKLCFGQVYIEDENWLKGFRTEADSFPTLSYWPPRTFTLEDVDRGKQRLSSIRNFTPRNEWEGVYYANTAIGDYKFIWNAEGGFFSFYFYHTLKTFYFGKIRDSSGFIELDYEKFPFSQTNRTAVFENKLIKVKIDETHFLVPENRLQDFCERAAGLTVDLDDFYYYRIKEDDIQKPRLGLPVLPAEYKKHLRYPIEAKIIKIGKKKIVPNEQSTKEYNFDDIHYVVTLNAGKDKKLKKDMNFFVRDLGEWIQLTEVLQTRSVGFIRRDFDEDDREQCRDGEGGSGQNTPCKKIKIGMRAKTRGDL